MIHDHCVILDLTSINNIFSKSIATTNSRDIIRCVLFQKKLGFPEDSKPILFDTESIERFKPHIEFMLGQLKDVHLSLESTTPANMKINYNNIDWTKSNNGALMVLLHLAQAADLINPIDAKTSNVSFKTSVAPTLSPLDVNFGEWFKKNKSKILVKYDGTEPADD